MLKTILIDDEPQSLQTIDSLIRDKTEIIGAYTDPFEGLEAIRNNKFDVLFLDIEMPELTGIELLKQVENKTFEVIFITAHHQYALEAFKLSALGYVLKPIDPDELDAALKEAQQKINDRRRSVRFEIFEKLLTTGETSRESQEKRIVLSASEGISYVQLKQIVRIESFVNYCTFSFRGGNSLTISKNLGFYEDALDPFCLMRIHRSHIVNLYEVVKYVRAEGGSVILTNGDKCPVSGTKKDLLLKRLNEL